MSAALFAAGWYAPVCAFQATLAAASIPTVVAARPNYAKSLMALLVILAFVGGLFWCVGVTGRLGVVALPPHAGGSSVSIGRAVLVWLALWAICIAAFFFVYGMFLL